MCGVTIRSGYGIPTQGTDITYFIKLYKIYKRQNNVSPLAAHSGPFSSLGIVSWLNSIMG